mmetsp:Transcript_24462/g.61062  ORF Transcript_24462/g.61062 Transcript_24462/m.61062 type:complete len:253 (-) Transcript_24462:1102-1860(-)
MHADSFIDWPSEAKDALSNLSMMPCWVLMTVVNSAMSSSFSFTISWSVFSLAAMASRTLRSWLERSSFSFSRLSFSEMTFSNEEKAPAGLLSLPRISRIEDSKSSPEAPFSASKIILSSWVASRLLSAANASISRFFAARIRWCSSILTSISLRTLNSSSSRESLSWEISVCRVVILWVRLLRSFISRSTRSTSFNVIASSDSWLLYFMSRVPERRDMNMFTRFSSAPVGATVTALRWVCSSSVMRSSASEK